MVMKRLKDYRMLSGLVLLCALLAVLFYLPVVHAAIPARPANVTYAYDSAQMLDSEDYDKIQQLGKELDDQTGAQIVVVTVAALDGENIEEYANQLFRSWGIGDKEKNNGVLLLLAKDDRQFRIEVGYGLEGAITDGYAGEVLDGMKSDFRDEKYSAAILDAYAKLAQKAYEEYNVAVPEDVKAVTEVPLWKQAFNVVTTVIVLVILLVLLVVVLLFLKWLLNLLTSGLLFDDEDDSGSSSGGSSGRSSSRGGSWGGGRSGGGGASGGW